MDNDLRPLQRSALHAADELIRRVSEEDLSRPTPCGSWNLGDLLAHMIGQHLGFAAAVRDGDAPRSAYQPIPYDRERWEESVTAVVEAFGGADLSANAVVVELAPTPLPVALLAHAQLLDTVVHTWDVAQALGIEYLPTAELAASVAQLAAVIPDDESRDLPDAAFAHSLPIDSLPSDGTDWERALAQLGRDPRQLSRKAL